MTHHTLVHKFIPIPTAMKIPDAKAAVEKEWKKLETIPAWQLDTVMSKRRLFWKHTETKRKSILLHWWTTSPQKRGVRTQIKEVRRQCRAPGGHCKRRLWTLRSIHWTRLVCVSDDGSKDHGPCCKITRLWRTSSWRSICPHWGEDGRCSWIA